MSELINLIELYNSLGEIRMIYIFSEYNKDGTEKHIIKEGSRHHVVWWDANGSHCSESNCELNKLKEK